MCLSADRAGVGVGDTDYPVEHILPSGSALSTCYLTSWCSTSACQSRSPRTRMAPRARPTGLQVHLQVCLQRPRSCTGENPGRRFSTCAFPCLSFPPTIHVTSLTIVSLLSRLCNPGDSAQQSQLLGAGQGLPAENEHAGPAAGAAGRRRVSAAPVCAVPPRVKKGKAPTPDIAGVECLRLPSEMCLQPATGTCQASFTACTASSAGRTRSGLSAGRSWPAATMGLTSCMQLWQRISQANNS